jgi:hypothetical protein
MTLKEISYNILNLYRGGRSSNNDHISLSQIEFNVKHYRALLLRRDNAKNGLITRHTEQDLGCLDLERVNASKCCSLPLECEVSRTILKIPRTVRFNNMDAITHVSDPSGMNTIPLVDSIAVHTLIYDRFTKNDKKAYMIEDHLYIYNPSGMDTVNLRGIFEDPEEIAAFECNGSDCYDPEAPFPLSMDMVNAITEGLVSKTLLMLPKTPSDTENDGIQSDHLPRRGGEGS